MTEQKPASLVWFTLACAIAFILLVALGSWQLYRLQWKTELIAGRQAALAAPVQPLPMQADQVPAMRDRRVTVSGTLHHQAERYLLSKTYRQRLGVHVLTPLQRADGSMLLVNRGWIPMAAKGAEAPPHQQQTGTRPVTVSGVWRVPSSQGLFTPDNEPSSVDYYWVDLDALRADTGFALLPGMLVADETNNPGQLPVGIPPEVQIPNNHLQYAITWYGLALALIGVYVAYRQRHHAQHRQPLSH